MRQARARWRVASGGPNSHASAVSPTRRRASSQVAGPRKANGKSGDILARSMTYKATMDFFVQAVDEGASQTSSSRGRRRREDPTRPLRRWSRRLSAGQPRRSCNRIKSAVVSETAQFSAKLPPKRRQPALFPSRSGLLREAKRSYSAKRTDRAQPASGPRAGNGSARVLASPLARRIAQQKDPICRAVWYWVRAPHRQADVETGSPGREVCHAATAARRPSAGVTLPTIAPRSRCARFLQAGD